MQASLKKLVLALSRWREVHLFLEVFDLLHAITQERFLIPAPSKQVNFQKVNGLLGTYTSDQGFICLTLYISNNTYSASCIDAKNPLQFLTSAYYSVAGKEGSAWQLERWQADGEKFFKWRVGTKAYLGPLYCSSLSVAPGSIVRRAWYARGCLHVWGADSRVQEKGVEGGAT